VGRRQVGKATSASNIGESRPSTYLDLEPEADWAKLAEPELHSGNQGEIQRQSG
jgi:uncharacterized protein